MSTTPNPRPPRTRDRIVNALALLVLAGMGVVLPTRLYRVTIDSAPAPLAPAFDPTKPMPGSIPTKTLVNRYDLLSWTGDPLTWLLIVITVIAFALAVAYLIRYYTWALHRDDANEETSLGPGAGTGLLLASLMLIVGIVLCIGPTWTMSNLVSHQANGVVNKAIETWTLERYGIETSYAPDVTEDDRRSGDSVSILPDERGIVLEDGQVVHYRIIQQLQANDITGATATRVILVDNDNNELPLVGAAAEAEAEKEGTS